MVLYKRQAKRDKQSQIVHFADMRPEATKSSTSRPDRLNRRCETGNRFHSSFPFAFKMNPRSSSMRLGELERSVPSSALPTSRSEGGFNPLGSAMYLAIRTLGSTDEGITSMSDRAR